jgi:hypothetical protein
MRDAVFAAQGALKSQFAEINQATTEIQEATKEVRASLPKLPVEKKSEEAPVTIPTEVVEQLKNQLIKPE